MISKCFDLSRCSELEMHTEPIAALAALKLASLALRSTERVNDFETAEVSI